MFTKIYSYQNRMFPRVIIYLLVYKKPKNIVLDYLFKESSDSASVDKMIPDQVISVSDVSKLCEDISSLYLNEKFSDVVLVVDGEKLHAHKVRFIICVDLYGTNLFYGHFKGNSCCEK
jgi:hypothetical protein